MRYNIIAIEREYASGGREIGEKLAKKLDIPCYGRQILDKAAVKLGLSVEQLEEIEETATGNLLFGLYLMSGMMSVEGVKLTRTQELSIAEAQIIKELVSQGPCVIIGRCATGVLQDHKYALKVFIHADWDSRRERAISVYGDDPSKVDSILKRFDKRRGDFFKSNIGMDWKDPECYHMILDSKKLGIDPIVDILYNLVK